MSHNGCFWLFPVPSFDPISMASAKDGTDSPGGRPSVNVHRMQTSAIRHTPVALVFMLQLAWTCTVIADIQV